MAGSKERKLPGKVEWAGRRRPATRRAGFSAKAAVVLQRATVDGYWLPEGGILNLELRLPHLPAGRWLGYGGWFYAPSTVSVTLEGSQKQLVLEQFKTPNWGKFGSLWRSDGSAPPTIRLRFTADKPAAVALWDVLAGGVQHDYLDNARSALLPNMWRFAPESNFYDPENPGTIVLNDAGLDREAGVADIYLKSCNRCGRLLPVNLDDERATLSFSNHCVAAHRRPCRHAGFGRIVDPATGQPTQLTYGFQLECRFCKKFEVNAAHNPQRTAGQMKEDAARRRAFEMLLDHLYQGSPQLQFRERHADEELADFIWRRFDGRCFKCGTPLASPRDMALDHTRPLALMWPLDDTATALCPTHNSEKRDRPPAQFYSEAELARLSEITGISLEDLEDPGPNCEAIDRLGDELRWFFEVFLSQPELARTHDGKRAGDLLVKALRKAIEQYPGGPPYSI